MISDDVKISTFEKVSKVFNGQIDGCAVPSSDGLSFLEKNEMGCHCPLTYCWRTAPTAESDASVIRLVGHWV